MDVLGFGGGQNTAGIIALLAKDEISLDMVIFADTGCEYPDTYRWADEIAKPVCEEKGVPFVTVSPDVEGFDNLYDFCFTKKIIPSRLLRWCTGKFKRLPINQYLKENIEGEYDYLIGFGYDEIHRVKGGDGNKYPLIERGLGRRDCVKLVESLGWPVPPKSGCYICPFARKGQWKRLYEVHPALFDKAVILEKNSMRYPELTLYGKGEPLVDLKGRLTDSKQTSLDGYEESCMMCHV